MSVQFQTELIWNGEKAKSLLKTSQEWDSIAYKQASQKKDLNTNSMTTTQIQKTQGDLYRAKLVGLLIKQNNEAKALALLHLNRIDKVVEIWDLTTSPKKPSKGAGTAAVVQAIALSQQAGYEGRVLVNPNSTVEEAYYSKLGFRKEPNGSFTVSAIEPSKQKYGTVKLDEKGQRQFLDACKASQVSSVSKWVALFPLATTIGLITLTFLLGASLIAAGPGGIIAFACFIFLDLFTTGVTGRIIQHSLCV